MRQLAGAMFLCLQAFALPFSVAQLPSGTIAPDFSVQDINGQSHHLYDLLNDNKIVLLEMSATWCPPCWAYQQGHAVQEFYAEHGPNGDNKARVFWIEGDPQTNVACIYGQQGCNNLSYGNFAEGVEYPILDNAAIADAYHITYYPSLFIVCPNKRLYEVEPLPAEALWERAQVCPVAYGQNNAGIFAHDPGYNLPEICGGVNLSPTFMLTNLGSQPLTSATIFTRWNGNVIQTIEWTGNLPTYGEAPIQFDPIPVQEAGMLNTVVSSINNNSGDDDFSNNYANNSYVKAQHFDKLQVVLKIRTDNYGNETYWELRDAFDNVLESGGNQWVGPNGGGAFPLGVDNGPGTYPSNTLIKDTLNLPEPGCYSIHFSDGFGDGMCCQYGNGYFKLYNIDNPVTPVINAGQYEAYDRHAFSAGLLTGISDAAAHTMEVLLFPNPADNLLYLDIESIVDADVSIRIFNAIGQQVGSTRQHSVAFGENTLEIPLNELAAGWYFLTLEPKDGKGSILSRKFAVRH